MISVDTKKKELVGDFKNGRPKRAKDQPVAVSVDALLPPFPKMGKAIPYGVYDL